MPVDGCDLTWCGADGVLSLRLPADTGAASFATLIRELLALTQDGQPIPDLRTQSGRISAAIAAADAAAAAAAAHTNEAGGGVAAASDTPAAAGTCESNQPELLPGPEAATSQPGGSARLAVAGVSDQEEATCSHQGNLDAQQALQPQQPEVQVGRGVDAGREAAQGPAPKRRKVEAGGDVTCGIAVGTVDGDGYLLQPGGGSPGWGGGEDSLGIAGDDQEEEEEERRDEQLDKKEGEEQEDGVEVVEVSWEEDEEAAALPLDSLDQGWGEPLLEDEGQLPAGWAEGDASNSRKRGRVLPGAQPFYSGPRPTPRLDPLHPHHPQQQQRQGGGSSVGGHGGAPRLSALHYELEAFAAAAAPSGGQLAAVDAALTVLQGAAHKLWPRSRVLLFGSQAAGLSLPGSDLDVVVLGVMQV